MTAHFIAPNSSPHIRYAVYFRVHGPEFDGRGGSAPESMLSPWCHWPVMASSYEGRQGKEKAGGGGGGGHEVELHEMHEIQASLDNIFLTPKVDGWACKACTYLHSGRELDMLACKICATVRE